MGYNGSCRYALGGEHAVLLLTVWRGSRSAMGLAMLILGPFLLPSSCPFHSASSC